MNTRSLLLGLGAGILLGGVCGWVQRGAAKTQVTAAAMGVQEVSNGSRRSSALSERAKEELLKLQAWKGSMPAKRYADWDVAELKAMIHAMLAQADPLTGLSFAQREALSQMMNVMAQKDRDGTLAWIDETFPTQRFNYYTDVMSVLIPDASVKDKIEFLKSCQFAPKEISNYVSNYLFTSESMDTEKMLYYLSNIVPRDGVAYSGECKFAPGFDFARVAEATVGKAREHGTKGPSSFPHNFLQEWARVAPQQAIDFYFKNCTGKNAVELPLNGVDKILSGVKSSVTAEEYSTWLGQTIQVQSQGRSVPADVIRNMVHQELGDPTTLAAALEQVQDATLKASLLRDALQYGVAVGGDPENVGKLRGALALYQDPSARLVCAEDIVRSLRKEGEVAEASRRIEDLARQLANLGHSAEEVQKVRDAK